MTFRLPPLNTLRFFEAAGRHLSFKVAAEELNVTPSAVSHGIQTLEDWLGVKLFARRPKGIVLTAAAAAYLPAVREALTTLSAATDRVPGRKARGSLSVSVAPTFASHWLLPRLSRFSDEFPDVVVTLDTAQRKVDLPLEGVDLAIRMAVEPGSDGTWLRLLRQVLTPVCAPALLEQFAGLSPTEALSRAPLIHVTTTSEDWARYLEAQAVDIGGHGGGLRFDTIQMALQAARQGLGIALGRRPLIDDDLRDGRLAELGAPQLSARTCYWLVGSEPTFDRPEAKAFRRWLIEEIEETGAEGSVATMTPANGVSTG